MAQIMKFTQLKEVPLDVSSVVNKLITDLTQNTFSFKAESSGLKYFLNSLLGYSMIFSSALI